ncbi:uncharacterized protein TNCV_722031 [Trichonephila clavipes]|nr:uncharacterized protein TNCV_722031 [Trichonephila clavipes]
MSACTHEHLEQIKSIAKTKAKSVLLKKCSNSIIKSLCECSLNVLKGNVPLTKNQKIRLSPHKKSLRKLSDRKVPLYKKRKLFWFREVTDSSLYYYQQPFHLLVLLFMEFSKEMILVPEDRVEIFDKLSDLDQQMQDILRNKTILESEKANQCLQVLQIFVKIHHPQREVIEETVEKKDPVFEDGNNITTKILNSAPTRYQQTAKNILDFLKDKH